MKKLSLTCALAGVCFALLVFAPLPSLAYTTTTVATNITSDTTWVPDYIYVVSRAISINARLTV